MAQHFDVAVVGPSLAGAIVAAMLARAGRRVVVAGVASAPGPGVPDRQLAGQLAGLAGRSQHVRAIHGALGLTALLRHAADGERPGGGARVQAVFSRQRIDLLRSGRTEDVCDSEIAAEFARFPLAQARPAAALCADDTRLGALLDRLPALPSWRPTWLPPWRASALRRELEGAWAQPAPDPFVGTPVPPCHPLAPLATAAAPFWGGPSDAPTPSRLHLTRLWGSLLAGDLPDLEGMQQRAAQFFRARAHAAGAAYVCQDSPMRLAARGRRLTHLVPADGRDMVGADLFVAAGEVPGGILPPSRLARLLAADADAQAARRRGALAVVRVHAHRASLPLGLAPAVLLLDGRHQPTRPVDPPLLVWQGPPNGTEVELTVACPLASTAAASPSWPVVHARLLRLMPYLQVRAPTTPWRCLPAAPAALHLPWGIFAQRPTTAAPNLTRAGEEMIPGLGVEGAYLTARTCLAWLHAQAGGRWAQPRPEPPLRTAA